MTKKQFSVRFKDNYSSFLLFARNLTHTKPEAKDLLQDAGIKAFKNISSLKTGSKFKPWFQRVIYNCFVSKYKKNKRRKELIESAGPNKSLFYNKTRTKNRGIDRLQFLDVMALLDNLSPKYKKCFKMHYKGFSYKEISKKFEIPVGTVKSRINTARNKMKKGIERMAA